jgi:signal transduction histidine kinase
MFVQQSWLSLFIVSIIGVLFGVALILIITHATNKRGQKPRNGHRIPTPETTTSHQKYLHSERLKDIYKLLTNLTSTLSYHRVLDIALDLSTGAISSTENAVEGLVSGVLLFTTDEQPEPMLHIAASRGFTRSDLRNMFPAQEGILKNTIDEGGPLITRSIAKDPELGKLFALQACKSAYCFPLSHGLDTYGVLLHGHPDPRFFKPERLEILEMIGNQAMIAIQNARLYKDLEQEKERMMEIQEEARKKLARDLHDGPTQSVAAIAMRVNFARRLLERDSKSASEELFKIEDLARKTTKEIRHMLFTLRPLVLESQGLSAALESMAEKMKETFDQNLLLEVDQQIEEELEMSKQGVLFAIAEEAANNARKYAQAEHIWVRLKFIQSDIASLEIQDDGVGFDIDAIDANYDNRGSLGLVNMRERAELLNGILTINATPGNGALIKVIFPLTEEASERLRHGG